MPNKIIFTSLLAILAVAAPFSPLHAQIVVVDPNGGGHFKTIQDALDASPAGAILQVKGGIHGPLVVRRSVTIIGDPRPQIRSSYYGYGHQPPSILLQGPGGANLRLLNVAVQDRTNGTLWNYMGEGIAGSGFSDIYIEQSLIEPTFWYQITGRADSQVAIRVPGGRIEVVDSVVRASFADVDFSDPGPGGNGAPGIIAETVVAIRSSIYGGGGEPKWLSFPPLPSTTCPCKGIGGHGGNAVLATSVYATSRSLIGGQGSRVWIWQGGSWIPWGQQPSGTGWYPGVIQIQDNGTTADPVRMGSTWGATFPALGGAGILVMGEPVSRPFPVGPDLLFINPAWINAIPLPPGGTSLSLPVPTSSGIAGVRVAIHIADFGTQRFSTPILRMVGF